MSSPPLEDSPLSRAMVEAWRADQPSPSELRRAYARYLEHRPRPHQLRVVGWVAAGLLLGMSLAQAAMLLPQHWFGLGQRGLVAPPTSVVPRARALGPVRLAPSAAASEPAPAAIMSGTPKLAAPPASRLAAPLPSAPSGTRMQEQWQRAAGALRAGDFARAHQALLEIERSVGGGERDAARLARAQLLASHGRGAEASLLLTQLKQHAESELVRRKAGELLAESFSEYDGRNRSTAPGGDTQEP